MTQAEFDKLTELLDREVLGNHMHGGEAAEVIAELEEVAQRDGLIAEIWHKGTEPPSNKHPYPVINPDTQEMAFAYYYLGWHYDRDYNPGHNMLWMDIEKILPKEP
jgi:hypothetical protein